MSTPPLRTNVECYDPCMAVTDQAAADAMFEDLVQYCMAVSGFSREKTEYIQRHNIGYWAGYFSDETRARVERLFKCQHPVFGAIADNGPPTMEQAYELGLAIGKRIS